MKIVIVGAEEIGAHLAKTLSDEDHEVVVIDRSLRKLDELGNFAEIIAVTGDATTFSVLENAEVGKCDLFLALSEEQNINIISSMMAKEVGAKKVGARIDNAEYLQTVNRELFINMGIDFLINPEKLMAQEIISLLDYTTASELTTFVHDRIAIASYQITETSPLVGKPIGKLHRDQGGFAYKIVAIHREAKNFIPSDSDALKAGDVAYFITEYKNLNNVVALSGEKGVKVRRVMIIGGSESALHVARELQQHVKLKIVEYNEERALEIADELGKSMVIHGDGRQVDLLMEEGLDKMDAFIALTGRAETNILSALVAKSMGVRRVITEVENINFIALAESMGLRTIVNKKSITASLIHRFTTATSVYQVKYILGGEGEAAEFIVKPDSPATKKAIKELELPKNSVIGAVVRGERVYIADQISRMEPYDRIIVINLDAEVDKFGVLFNKN